MTTQWLRKVMRREAAADASVSDAAQAIATCEIAADDFLLLPEIVADSISIHDGSISDSLPGDESISDTGELRQSAQGTCSLSSLAKQSCSIEFHTTETLTRSQELRAAPQNGNSDDNVTHERVASVVVPLRTLKTSETGATAADAVRAERFANRTTQAGCFNPVSDTVVGGDGIAPPAT